MYMRPDPDKLLNKYSNIADKRGKLTVFLGAAAGVGKTYAMLKQVIELQNKSIDVVIGYIECHQRSETHAMMPTNIEIIPLHEFTYHGISCKELDLDAILVRKPQVVIIDELAHTNIHGSRNIKRYQDVLEILAAGIDVYTAVNVQHIESLNDVVTQIVGTGIKETVPDYILEQATEVKLIDVTPDELIARLKDGKIYPIERAAKALDHFFRKGNLTALREIALLKTARKVEKQVKLYRSENSIDKIWSSHDSLMVVLEIGYSSEKIIRSGKAVFDKGFSNWFVVYMADNEFSQRNLKQRESFIKLLDFARGLGAQVMVLNGDRLDEAIVSFAKENNINTVLLSQSRLNLYYRLFNSSLADKIRELSPEINLHLVTNELSEITQNQLAASKSKEIKKDVDYNRIIRKIFISLIIFTTLGIGLLPIANYTSNINILMAYLLVLVLTSRGRGTLSSIITAFVATLSFDFFYIPPRFSLSISDLQYLFTFIVMTIVGITFGVMNGNLRFQLNISRKIQKQTRILYGFSRKLAESMVEVQVIEALREFMPKLVSSNYAILLPNSGEELYLADNYCENLDMVIAQWVFNNLQSAGNGTNTFATNKLYYVPIHSKIRSRGVLVLNPITNDDTFFLPDTQELIENILQLLATTLERIHFTQIAIQTEVMLAKQDI